MVSIFYLFFILCIPAYVHATQEASVANCSCVETSKSFFTVRPQFQVASPEVLSSWRRQQTLKPGECNRTTIQAIPYGGRSTHPGKLGTYFMPFCSARVPVTSIIPEEGQAFNIGALPDIPIDEDALFAQNFNIPSIEFTGIFERMFITNPLVDPFTSIISVSPRQSVIGLGLSFQYNFCLCGYQHWFRINAPILHVRNTMNLNEEVFNTGLFNIAPVPNTNLTSQQPNMISALSQPQWNYGKIDNRKHKTTRLAFIQMQLGHVLGDQECYYISPYVGLNIPTGNTPTGEFVFEPVAGNGKHFGILWGLTSEMFLFNSFCKQYEIGGAIDINMEYLFKKSQRRSLDLKNRPWSRYIELYESRAQSNQVIDALAAGDITTLQAIFINSPGINLLTQKVKIKPGFNFTANLALTLTKKCDRGFDGEVGYNFYAKQAECISLKNKDFNIEEAAIKDHIGQGFTNQVRPITQNRLLNEASDANLIISSQFNATGARATYDRSIIKKKDLNFASASHPCTLSNIVYATAGYHWDSYYCHPKQISVGLSYEFALKSNATLNRWLLWGRWGIAF